jgi:NADH dehydrogenase
MLSKLVGSIFEDVVLTEDEIDGLMAGLLVSSNVPRGKKSLGDWLMENRDIVGKNYVSELARHYQR